MSNPLDEKSASVDAPNTFKAVVTKVSPGISDYRLVVQFGKTVLIARLERSMLFDFHPRVGEDVKVLLSL